MAELETVQTTSDEAEESTSEVIESTSDETEETQETPQVDNDSIILEALQNPSEAVQKYINELLQNEVKKALAGATPKKATTKAPIITKDDFCKMKYSEKAKLYNENRELYNTLAKR